MSTETDKIKRKLLVKYPTFGSIIANLDFQPSNSIDTADTDGKVLLYNPDFLNNLNENQQIFLFAHEVCHVAFDHIFRSEGKDKDTWDTAADAVTNALLVQDGLTMIDGGVNIPEAINYDVEEMYNKLLKEKQQSQGASSSQGKQNDKANQGEQGQANSSGNQPNDKQNSQSSQGQKGSQESKATANSKASQKQQGAQNNQENQISQKCQTQQDLNGQAEQNGKADVGHDTHSLWDKAIEDRKKELEQEKSEGEKGDKTESSDTKKESSNAKSEDVKQEEQKQENSNDDSNNTQKAKDKKEQEKKVKDKNKAKGKNKFVEQGEKETFKQNRIERKKRLQELSKELAKQSSQEAGNEIQREGKKLSDIGISAPLIDWRRLLRQAIKFDEEWTRKNARMRDGFFRHRLEQIPIPETEIVLDTSGSVSEILLKNFLRECKNILENSRVKVGCFNTEFHGFTEIKHIEDIDNMQFPIGGGTNFDAAVKAFSRRACNKIIFTDGQAPMPKETVRNVIWIVFGNEKIKPKGGRVISITGEQLQKLCTFVKEDVEVDR